jgi:hypothetical protein
MSGALYRGWILYSSTTVINSVPCCAKQRYSVKAGDFEEM